MVTIRMSLDSSLSMSREKPRRCAMAVLPETVSVNRLCLLLLQFRRDEAHLRSLRGRDNRFGIRGIVLLALHEWAHCGAISRTSWPSFVISRDQ